MNTNLPTQALNETTQDDAKKDQDGTKKDFSIKVKSKIKAGWLCLQGH